MNDTRVVIQCAGKKAPNAGYFRDRGGRRIKFVARPGDDAPAMAGCVYARPDDVSDVKGETWRQRLEAYNNRNDNPLWLCQAYRLYCPRSFPRIYDDLARCFGAPNIFILSAGWGLVRGEFLLPDYDITLSAVKRAERYKHRSKADTYEDFCQLDRNDSRRIIFLCGKEYVELLRKLNDRFPEFFRGEKVLFYATDHAPEIPGWRTKRFKKHTNWQYKCAEAVIEDVDRALAPT